MASTAATTGADSGARSGRGPQGLDPVRSAAWRAFLEAHARTTARLGRELQEGEDLPLAWYDVLVHLSEGPSGGLRMQELADRVLLSQSGLTRLVDRMETEGLVERHRCADDGRGTLAVLTRAGLARLRRAFPSHLAGVREAFGDLLSDEEAVVLARALQRIAAASQPTATAAPDGPCAD